MGVSVATLAAGVALLAVHGQPTCERDFGKCPERRNTQGAGVGLTVAGALSGAGAAVLFYLGARSKRKETTRVAPWFQRDGGGLAAVGRF